MASSVLPVNNNQWLENLRQKIEWQVLAVIENLSDIGKMTKEQAKMTARHVLKCIKPNMTPQEFFRGVFQLDDGFPELSFIVVPIAQMYKEKVEDVATTYIRDLIHTQKYDTAVSMARKLIDTDIGVKFVARGGKAI